MKNCCVIISILWATSCLSVTLDKDMQGVFSNKGPDFSHASLMINHDGVVLVFWSTINFMGEGKYDKKSKKFVIEFLDPISAKEDSVSFIFDKKERAYTILNMDAPYKTFVHVSDEIPDEVRESFKKYPAAIKQKRVQIQREREREQAEKEKLEREEPEYQQLLKEIRDNPKCVVSEKFFTLEFGAKRRALETALSDKQILFTEETLCELLEKMPSKLHNNLAAIFARTELSTETIERYYPKTLEWGRSLNYTILANLARNANTPMSLICDLALRRGIPGGGTQHARQRLVAALGDKNIPFTDETLCNLLEKISGKILPPQSEEIQRPWWFADFYRMLENIFSRSELSKETIKRFYPQVIRWRYSSKILANIAQNPNTPINFVRDLTGQNPTISAETLQMFQNANKRDHYDILSHSNLPADFLEAMGTSHIENPLPNNGSIPVLGRVARHPNVPLSVLEKLARLDYDAVKDAVARNPKATVEVLRLLAKNGNSSVRGLVVQHPNATKDIIDYCRQQK